jgi:Ca2+-binding EF-hand superfamily protein
VYVESAMRTSIRALESRGGQKGEFQQILERERACAEKAKGVFMSYDTNGDGYIDEDELGGVLMAISDKFTKKDIKVLMAAADANGDKRISICEFIDWLTGPAKGSLGKAVTESTKALEVLFNVYDKALTGKISEKHFEECHVVLQSALRLVDVMDEDDHRNGELQHDKEEAEAFIAEKAIDGQIGFLDFMDWMKQHVPRGMSQQEFEDFTMELASTLGGTFDHSFRCEEGYVQEKASLLNSVSAKLSDSMKAIKAKRPTQSASVGQSPWDSPPKGFSVDRLKATHMMVMPLNMKMVKDVSWEVLCLPAGSAGAEVWVAEVVRRVLMQTGKLKCENPECYRYDVEGGKWMPCTDDRVSCFSAMGPGLGLFCLLKTAANFEAEIRWHEIKTALEGGVDMGLIYEDQIQIFSEHILQLVLDQMEEDGVRCGDSREDKLKYVQRYIANELRIHPGMVMATLLKLDLVPSDPAWESFVQEA